jgi:hypothetical protein
MQRSTESAVGCERARQQQRPYPAAQSGIASCVLTWCYGVVSLDTDGGALLRAQVHKRRLQQATRVPLADARA